MLDTRIKISSVVQNQLPNYIKEEFPLVGEFLSEYYNSQENQGGSLDILANIDRYIKIDSLADLTEGTTTTSSIGFGDNKINVLSTKGFPDSYGLIKIGSEIITYKSKTDTSFDDCVRGFSGITSLKNDTKPDELVFSTSEIETHESGSSVSNLSILFLKEFFAKVKKQFAPGFADRGLYSGLNQNLFLKQTKDFYSAKGTDYSFEILFRALYGEDVQVIKPRDYLFTTSDADYRISRDLVVESLEGNPFDLINRTLYQDNDSYFTAAQGAVNNVEKITRNGKDYYIISLDYNPALEESNTYPEFSIHSTTKLVTSCSVGAETIDVDSTLGFPNSGTIIAELPNGSSTNITYTSKSYTQFYGCSGINQNLSSGQNLRINSNAYGIVGDNIVSVRVTGVLSELNYDRNTKYHGAGETVLIKTLGKNSNDVRSNDWIFNIPTTYVIDTLTLTDSTNFSYTVSTKDDHNIFVGDKIKFIFSDSTEAYSSVIDVLNKKSFIVEDQGSIDVNKKYKVQKLVSKANFLNFPSVSRYSTNVQNTYQDNNGSFYITSSSLPNYLNNKLSTKNPTINFSGTFSGKDLNIGIHPFYTGDVVYYSAESPSNSLGIPNQIYFVKRVNPTTIRLSTSRSNLFKELYISFDATVTDNKIILNNLKSKELENQKIIRNIKHPSFSKNKVPTKNGPIGILVNGVEISNYKSGDSIFYGPLEKIEVLSPGSNYDVINPPTLLISDTIGYGATAYCEVEGSIEEIQVIDGGFDYITTPTISVIGGSGSGIKAEPKMIDYRHFSTFDSKSGVDISNNKITFPSNHKFKNGERVIYNPEGQQAVSGLNTNSSYYISVISKTEVSLHTTYENALNNSGIINLSNYGIGYHRLSSANLKRKIDSVLISDTGTTYRNRKISIDPVGVNTFSNTISAKDHGYLTGEVITYNSSANPIGGLENGKSYYITSVDQDTFKLSNVGSASTIGIGSAFVGVSTTSDFYFKTNQYINFDSIGSGSHIFNYPEIRVVVTGKVGIPTTSESDYQAILRPIVKGKIKSVFIENGGYNYGTEDILNFNRQPAITAQNGTGAELIPIILNGKIEQVLVKSSGSGYNSTPSIEVIGSGVGAKLVPIISNGSIQEVKVVKTGIDYSYAKLDVIPSGSGVEFVSTPKKWNINLVERNIKTNQITDDDGIIVSSVNSDYGLQYTHSYAPRELRKTVFSKQLVNGQVSYLPDLILENGREIESKYHSPIIGWAYDGNPIYGPYGYSSINGGSVKILKSGYQISLKPNRPSTTLFPEGFFVEDFEYQANGDLDEHNGRFCVTPEFPNGVYAYFSTIDNSSIESSLPFRNYRKPVFPYFIGNNYKSELNEYNLSPVSNQDSIDLKDTAVFRNINPYNLYAKDSGYDYILNPNEIKKHNSVIRFANSGSVTSIGIKTGGLDYSVGDVILFDNDGSGGSGLSAKVSFVKGKDINSVTSSSVSITGIEFAELGSGSVIGFSTSPHNLNSGDLISLTGFSTVSRSNSFVGPVSTVSQNLLISVGVGTTGSTGIVTYFNVSGNLNFPNIRENDILTVNSEKVKVLNVDQPDSRIKVLREYDSTTGVEHGVGSLIFDNSRKIIVGLNLDNITSLYNKEIYFNPIESIGIGITSTVGSGTTLFFSNPGTGKSFLYVPTKSIFLQGHNLSTGDELIYSSNGGDPITVSTDGSNTFQLYDNQVLYTAKISDDLIGISTYRVGLSSGGQFRAVDSSIIANTLYFTNIGLGEIHSFKTNYRDTFTAELNKNSVTVSTAETHGLSLNNIVDISCLPGISTTYKVTYNDHNRRLLINPKSFVSGDVDASLDTIYIESHGYVNGQKVIHTSPSPSGGLENNKIYFIIKKDNNRIRLAETYYKSISSDLNYIDITSASSGTISLVNPKIIGTKNQEIIFDVSDSSLAYSANSVDYSAFEFNLYRDSDFKEQFNPRGNNGEFLITRNGKIGVDSDATVSIKLTQEFPKEIYYNLVPIDHDLNKQTKLDIVSDSENITNKNKLEIIPSKYSGKYSVIGISNTSFTYNIPEKPERSSYTKEDAFITYKTNSTDVYGEIADISIISGGYFYKELPKFDNINTLKGYGAVLEPYSNSIGKIAVTEIVDIGFDYPSDTTLRPVAAIPQILKLNLNSSFKRIGISSVGKKYNISPDLIVIDSLTKDVISDVDLKYNVGDKEVTILKNTIGISQSKPNIIPVNNSNGIGINSISYNNSTKEVVVGLAVSYSSASDYPFAIGDRVLIENINVGVSTASLKGYNSSNYEYSLFTLTAIDPNIGGANGTVTYSLENYLESGEEPGTFDQINSSGIITPEKFFPTFDIELTKNNFNIGEEILSETARGRVEKWYPNSGLLAVSTIDEFKPGELIRGYSSKTQATIETVTSNNSHYKVSSSTIMKKGWNLESGFLNNENQRLHDSDYYQYFSYSLKSKVQYEDWKESVSSLNHSVGFKKFSDLIVESSTASSGIATEQNSGDFSATTELISEIGLNCYYDYDLARENNLKFNSNSISNKLRFNSSTLQDYFESIGNRVLIIDDISTQFNSNPRPTNYSVVDLFDVSDIRSRKYIAYIVDRRFLSEKQIIIASLIHNDTFGFLNQYGRVETVSDLGSFDFIINGSEGQLLFYPNKFSVNNYSVNLVSYDIRDSISGIGTENLGDTVKIESSTKTLSSGLSVVTNLVSLASTYRASKILLQYGAVDDSYFEYDELTLIHDGTSVDVLEYGQLTTNTLSPSGSIGLGTYSAYISGSELRLDFTPNVGLGITYNVNAISISLADTSSSGISSTTLKTGKLQSTITSIASSTSPISSVISEYENSYSCAYYIACLEDTTNNQYQVSEIIVADDGTNSSIVTFADLYTNSNLGTFDADISGGKTRLKFTPIANADFEVRVFQNALGSYDDDLIESIDFINSSIDTGAGSYEGTESDIRRSFELLSKNIPIFRRNIIGNSSAIVNLQDNSIKLPNHYFVTGEELVYTNPHDGTSSSIGISTVSIPGIGTTDKLPESVYAIKVSDSKLRFASSAENALKVIPEPLIITSVGIGTSHALTSKKQNSRVLLSIDNVIQSPIVSSSVTSILISNVSPTDQLITLSGITSFTSGNLIQINNEIMKINSVGVGSTNVFSVQRPWMGTGISSHSSGSLIRKISGDYNIVDNTINFVSPPYGLVPIGTITNGPNEADYLGISTYSSFSGRSFMRSGTPDTSDGPYDKNYILDDISPQFTGYTTAFNLTSNTQNVTGISTDNGVILINQIFQSPISESAQNNYSLKENLGITSIRFGGSISTTSYDVNNNDFPRGGIIVSVGASKGFGYQPLVAAGGTAVVSGLGTISSISIGNSGSGYRSGLQVVKVGIRTENLENIITTYIGIASISNGNVVSVAITNPGTGYTSTNPPVVIFDDPLSYSDIPLIYSQSSPSSGFGTGAKVNVVVGQGSSVIDFEITNFGYGYGNDEILTVGLGGTVGIPTNASLPFEEFRITVDSIFTDTFSGWTFGNLLVLDSLDSLFDGIQKSFQISRAGIPKSIRSKPGSNIDVQATLLVFINDILQVPGEGYVFEGGSFIDFIEAPKNGDTSKIIFYQGSAGVDVEDVDILETIKYGDTVKLYDDDIALAQNDRLVSKIISIDTLETNSYNGPGLLDNENYERSVIWCKQTEDIFIAGKEVPKDRTLYEPLIYPCTKIIQPVGTSSTTIFVESVKTFFDSNRENSTLQNKIRIVSQDNIVGASATAIVSVAGTISAISITNSGFGYTTAPSVTIGNPVGLGSTQRSLATSSLSGNSLSSITVSSPGTGYTSTNPPSVLIDPPQSSNYIEDITSISYTGDFGIISGISTISVGVASTGIVFDFVIPENSFLRDPSIVGTSLTVSGIQTGYYFVVYNSNLGNVGSGLTSLRSDGSVVSIGNSFLDNVYYASQVSIAETGVSGFGVTYVAKVTVSVSDYDGLSGIGYSSFFGEYSWGRISAPSRGKPREFSHYNNGLVGVSTSPIVERFNHLKSINYN